MRRGFGIALAIVVILLVAGVGIGAYQAGITEGLERAGASTEVVRVGGPGYGWGFPFGLLFFPLLLFAIFALVRGAFGPRRWEGHHHGGPWGPGGGREAFEAWHRRQHEPEAGDRGSAGGEPASV